MVTAERLRVLAEALVAVGWPPPVTRPDEHQGSPLVSSGVIPALAPDEFGLALFPPPFFTVAEDAATNPQFWQEPGVLDGIDPDDAVLIADFGSGSDTVMIADLRGEPASVLRLVRDAHGNRWEQVADDVQQLPALLGLSRRH